MRSPADCNINVCQPNPRQKRFRTDGGRSDGALRVGNLVLKYLRFFRTAQFAAAPQRRTAVAFRPPSANCTPKTENAVRHSKNTAVSLARGTAVTAINKYINSTKRVLFPFGLQPSAKLYLQRYVCDAIPAKPCLQRYARRTWPAVPYLRPNLRSTPTPSTPLRRL